MTFKQKGIDLSPDFLGCQTFAVFVSSCDKNVQEIFSAFVQYIWIISLYVTNEI